MGFTAPLHVEYNRNHILKWWQYLFFHHILIKICLKNLKAQNHLSKCSVIPWINIISIFTSNLSTCMSTRLKTPPFTKKKHVFRKLCRNIDRVIGLNMGVSKNSGTPKSSILIRFSIINHAFWSTPIVGNTHMGNGWVTPTNQCRGPGDFQWDLPRARCLPRCALWRFVVPGPRRRWAAGGPSPCPWVL